MLRVCLGIFPSLSHLILKASIIPLCVVRKWGSERPVLGTFLFSVYSGISSPKVEKPFHIPLTPGSLPPALTFVFLNTWIFSCPYLPWPLSSICQVDQTSSLTSMAPYSSFASYLCLVLCWLIFERWHSQHSAAFLLSSCTLPVDQVYPLGFEARLHADDLLVLNSSPDLPLNFSLISMATCLTSPSIL